MNMGTWLGRGRETVTARGSVPWVAGAGMQGCAAEVLAMAEGCVLTLGWVLRSQKRSVAGGRIVPLTRSVLGAHPPPTQDPQTLNLTGTVGSYQMRSGAHSRGAPCPPPSDLAKGCGHRGLVLSTSRVPG